MKNENTDDHSNLPCHRNEASTANMLCGIQSKSILGFILACSLVLNLVLSTLTQVKFTNDLLVRTSSSANSDATVRRDETFGPSQQGYNEPGRVDGNGKIRATDLSTDGNEHSDQDDRLPSCRSLFLQSSHYDNRTIDNFLTDSPLTWVRRSDGSRVLHLDQCHLHKYSAPEARQCLAQQHLYFTGDSLTRYQYLSLAYFLHTGAYPPRFGVPRGKQQEPAHCTHYDTVTQHTTCSPIAQPNIVMEGDFRVNALGADAWEWYHAVVGGWTDGSVWEGHMECNCARSTRKPCNGKAPGDCLVENLLYYHTESNNDAADDESDNTITLSFTQETGWDNVPRPLQGFHFTHCGRTGSCRRTLNDTAVALQRAFVERNYDWNQSLTDALRTGLLEQELPPIDIALYNRGLWNKLPVPAARALMPLLRQASRVGCYYKTTTGSQRSPPRWKHEREQLRPVVQESGCGWYDVGWLTAEFSELNQTEAEYDNVFWDAVHFQPWVYEELNNMLLNVLCNERSDATGGASA